MADTTAATKARLEKAVIHRNLRLGKLTLTEVLEDTPECLLHTPALFVVGMLPHVATVGIAELNYEAIRRGINLALPFGALTTKARTFLINWDTERRNRKEKRNAAS